MIYYMMYINNILLACTEYCYSDYKYVYICKLSQIYFSLQLCCHFVLLPPSSSAFSFFCTWQLTSSTLSVTNWPLLLITFVHITYTCPRLNYFSPLMCTLTITCFIVLSLQRILLNYARLHIPDVSEANYRLLQWVYLLSVTAKDLILDSLLILVGTYHHVNCANFLSFHVQWASQTGSQR